MKSLWRKYCRNTQGNFGILFSVVIGVLALGVAVAIEVSQMHGQRAALQDMADSAALSGAYIAKTDVQGREQTVRENIKFHQAYVPDLGLSTNAVVNFDDDNEEVSVTIPRSYESFFSGLIGKKNIKVSATTTVSYRSEAVDPVSIAFALDVSGSMGDFTNTGAVKLAVLKQSTKLLFDELEEASEKPELLQTSLRTGMTAYNTSVVATENFHWGWSHLESSVDALIANGGTNSTPALQGAYDQLKYDRSFRTSNDPKFQMSKLREYVIFMTDGDNNQPVWDTDSQAICETMRADGIEVYSIAFTAPEKGQLLLLDCASWNSGVEPTDKSEYEDNPNDNEDDNYDIEIDANGKKKKKCKAASLTANGRAKGRCKKEEEKSDFFFDAENAEAFKSAFARIGKEIAQNTIRITG